MKPKDISEAKDPNLAAALIALRRAAALARKIAIQTDTHIVIMENGQLIRIGADELRRQAKETEDAAHKS
jgi:hypothetical protein